MSQNDKSYKVRVICKDGYTFDFPPIPAICMGTAVAIAEQQAMSSDKCGIISTIEAQNTNFPITENATEVALKKEVDRLRGVVKKYIAKESDKKYTEEDLLHAFKEGVLLPNSQIGIMENIFKQVVQSLNKQA